MRKWLTSLSFAVFIFFATLSAGFSQTAEINIQEIVAPSVRLTTHWCFVVDNSHSMRDVSNKALGAFLEATRQPTDQLEFAIYAFSDRSMERFLDWQWATEESLAAAATWINTHERPDILSYGAVAIREAIKQERDELTVLLITDGGFTEASMAGGSWDVIRRAIKEGQDWRAKVGLGEAIIVSIGIENPHYSAGNKPSNEQCQSFLREIGAQYRGGYYYVTGALR